MSNYLELLEGLYAGQDEAIGNQEILGYHEILGAVQAASAAKVRGSAAYNAAMAAKLAKRSPIVQNVHPTKKRRWVVGFGPAAIPPNTTVTVQSQPQCLFRGQEAA